MSANLQQISVKGANTDSVFSSQNPNNQRFERVLCNHSTSPLLTATGTCLGVNPDRITLKKIILSGFAVKVKNLFRLFLVVKEKKKV